MAYGKITNYLAKDLKEEDPNFVDDENTLNKVKELAKDENNLNKIGQKESHLKIIFETNRVIEDKKSYISISTVTRANERIETMCGV